MIPLNSEASNTPTFRCGVLTDTFALKLICGLPLIPFFVVIIITPFEALEPYIAVAEASFNIVKDSILSGGIMLKGLEIPVTPELSTGTPSMTIRGSLVAFKDEPPRIRMSPPPSGFPPLMVTTTPGV